MQSNNDKRSGQERRQQIRRKDDVRALERQAAESQHEFVTERLAGGAIGYVR